LEAKVYSKDRVEEDNRVGRINMQQVDADIRIKVLDMLYRSKSPHIGSCFSCVEILSTLYGSVMKYDCTNRYLPTRDRFIMSKGHAAAAMYATLAEFGFFPTQRLDEYGKHLSPFTGHVSEDVPGVEVGTGSLGHGLPIGVGMAIALKESGQRVFVLCSDGDMNEGSTFEAMALAAQLRLTNLVMIVDSNTLQACGPVEDVLGINYYDLGEALGWQVSSVDGHDSKSIESILNNKNPWLPSMVIAHTIKGRGVSFMENSLEWHYKHPSDEEYAAARKELEDAKTAS
jgi:transketolase